MRSLFSLLTLLVSLVLTACGGGGGSPGLSSGSSSTFTVLAPGAVTLQVGALQQYAIKGGQKPYSVYSSDPAVAMGWVGGDDNVFIGAVVAGSADVFVVDAKNTQYKIAVKAGSSTAFFTTAASAITVTPGVAYAQTYTLGGGTPPYSATSSFPAVATVTVNGNQVTITGVQISGTGSNITIRDAAGATLSVAVTVGTVPLSVSPNNVSAFLGDKVRAVITGGTKPYRLYGGLDDFIINAQVVEGNILEVVGNMVVEKISVIVVDANNQTAELTLKLTPGQDVLRMQPSALSIPQSTTTPDITLMVYGASQSGGIQVFTTNTSVLKPQTPVVNVDKTGYAVKLLGGNTCSSVDANGDGDTADVGDTPGADKIITITVLDAKGRVGTATITTVYTAGQGGCV
ncbi:MAG: hypothetical protein U1E84_10150 [Rhodoferax sp.]